MYAICVGRRYIGGMKALVYTAAVAVTVPGMATLHQDSATEEELWHEQYQRKSATAKHRNLS